MQSVTTDPTASLVGASTSIQGARSVFQRMALRTSIGAGRTRILSALPAGAGTLLMRMPFASRSRVCQMDGSVGAAKGISANRGCARTRSASPAKRTTMGVVIMGAKDIRKNAVPNGAIGSMPTRAYASRPRVFITTTSVGITRTTNAPARWSAKIIGASIKVIKALAAGATKSARVGNATTFGPGIRRNAREYTHEYEDSFLLPPPALALRHSGERKSFRH